MPNKSKALAAVDWFSKNKKTFFLLLTILTGIITLWPLHNFQNYLSQGDHGRDLYCFKKVMEGAIPYRDFSWLFGPLMPYYYGIFYVLFGVSIQSVLLGQCLLVLLAGVAIFLACSVFLPPAISFLCAFWYWSFRGVEFFYTYNHIGGVLALLVTFYCLLQYIDKGKLSFVRAGFISVFLLTLIRLNMGVAALIAFALSLLLVRAVQKRPQATSKRQLVIYPTLIVLSATALVYWALLYPLPDYAIYQSFPYGKSQRTDFSPTSLSAVLYFLKMLVNYFSANAAQTILGALLFLSSIQTAIFLFSKKLEQKSRINLILAFISLFIFIIFASHEFIASGVFYRTAWVFPFIYIGIFFLISTATKNFSSKTLKILVLVVLFFPSIWNTVSNRHIINFLKEPGHMLNIGKTRIYTSQDPRWFKAVTDATNFIKENVPPADKILVLPLDPLYLFLSDRDSATRQLVFFEHIGVTHEQELATIAQMEEDKGNWVILSNRADSPEEGLGTFGRTYCPLLAKYMDEHFVPVAEFGDWAYVPGWAWNHGVRIYKRK